MGVKRPDKPLMCTFRLSREVRDLLERSAAARSKMDHRLCTKTDAVEMAIREWAEKILKNPTPSNGDER